MGSSLVPGLKLLPMSNKQMFEKSILVTGGAGFIGANFVSHFSKAYPHYRIIDLDALTYAAHPAVFELQAQMGNVVPVKGNICDAVLIRQLLRQYSITGVIHFAAESHVDNSIANPLIFVETNVNGTANLLNECQNYWREIDCMESARFHHISTDEVYGSLGTEGFFTEDTPYAPNSPYSASKASSDLLVRAYAHTYGLNTTISNCSNNYGPWQHSEKFIPTIIRKCLAHEPIPVYGKGLNIRDWLWVGDHCQAIDLIFHKGKTGESYNVGGHNERTNLQIVDTVCNVLNELHPWNGHDYNELLSFVNDRPGHDFRYAIDPSKISEELGWISQTTFEQGIRQTVQWYLR